MVEATFRPSAEDPRSLLDFVDEQDVETMRDALKESVRQSQVRYLPLVPKRSNKTNRKHKQNSTPRYYPLTMTSEPSRQP